MHNPLKDIDVLILCGGFGRRLKDICGDIPKPMVRISDYPFLNILIDYLANFGFRKFILGVGYKSDIIKGYYKDKETPERQILFSEEKIPLDTGGTVKNAKKLVNSNPFFVLNGDTFSEFNPFDFLSFHKQKRALVSILLKNITNGRDYGEIKIDEFSRIRKFSEKDSKLKRTLINAGIYIFEREIFGLMPSSSRFSLERDFFPHIINERIFGYTSPGFFIDIGTPERYSRAKQFFLLNNKGYIK